MKYLIWVLCLIPCLILITCTSSNGIDKIAAPIQGEKTTMISYPLGRFSMKVPADMKLETLSQSFRACEIQEFFWKQGNREQERTNLWNARIAEIDQKRLPDGIKRAIIDSRTLKNVGNYARGVFYYSDDITTRRGDWDVLVDSGSTGIWFKFRGDIVEKEEMLNWVTDIARGYQGTKPDKFNSMNAFYLKYGAIPLPYIEQESTYARFEGHPLDLKLELEMTETHTDEPEDEGLLARTAALIATGYATGVEIERLRFRKRRVAGLDGEEEVDRMADKHRTALSFMWRYAGKKDSGEYPEIVLEMESPDGNLKEKLKIWDAILKSMKPLYKN